MTETGKNIFEDVNDIICVDSDIENVIENVDLLGENAVETVNLLGENVVGNLNLLGDNVVDNVNLLGNNAVRGEGVSVPEVGMKFTDENEMFDFYKRYAYDIGFPVRKRNSKKDDDGVMRYVTFVCSREGKRGSHISQSLKSHATVQYGCKARITASSDIHGIWKINTVHLEHNHKTSPSKSRLYRCNRELSDHVKRRLEVNDMAGIPLHKSFNSTVVEAGAYENMTFIEKDCRNYVEQVRRLRLGEGDATAIQSYFSKMQSQCSGFYFSIDLDEESRLKNVFWADYRSRQAFKEFGDVVTFDTTYLVNRYDMPFAPFVGVNHHGQSILLGCGLIANEDTDTFVWLFSTWLQCMHGQAPLGIITDQDRAMQNAIHIVFPNTRHRWCLWHILKKLPEKFGNHENKASIFFNIHELVYDSQFVDEFEQGWTRMIEKHNLVDNDWLSGLYANRRRWVPCYLKTMFWAGMSTTQRSESMNAFFDGYVHAKTSLKQFVEQYERALRNKVEKEVQADFKSYSQMVICATRYELEKQFQAVYTISKFKEVQAEFTGKVYCDLISTSEGGWGTTYEVREDVMVGEHSTKKTFFVLFDRDKCEHTCSCHLFEFKGIICRHALAVLIRNDVKSLPERYILRRWRRDVVRVHTRVAVTYDGLTSTPAQSRYEKMVSSFANLANMTADDDVKSGVVLEWIDGQCKQMMTSKYSSSESNVLSPHINQIASQGLESQDTGGGSVKDPKCAKRKGAPRKLRKKGPLESASNKTNASSNSTRRMGPNTRPTNTEDGVNIIQAPQNAQYSTQIPFSYQQMLMGVNQPLQFTQDMHMQNVIPSSSRHVILNAQGIAQTYDIGFNPMSFGFQQLPYNNGANQ